MAFAQQQVRPRQRSQPSFTSTDATLISPSLPPNTNRILSPGQTHVFSPPSTSSTSDSETDWHVISSALRSTTSSSSSGSDISSLPHLPLHNLDRRDSLSIASSEIESYSSFRPSDTESFSDIDFAFDVLPSHDGTGAFTEDDPTTSEEEHHQPSGANVFVLRTRRGDFEPASPSMPNILLPYGGIHLPSFATDQQQQQQSSLYHTTVEQPESPSFQPTVIAKDLILSSDESRQQDGYNSTTTNTSGDQVKYTRKRPSIPTHHNTFPGSITSFAILSAIWNNLRRLTNHLIENDTYTADAFTTLVSEATLEGCLPFGSHLHMELAAGIRPAYTTRGYDGLPGM